MHELNRAFKNDKTMNDKNLRNEKEDDNLHSMDSNKTENRSSMNKRDEGLYSEDDRDLRSETEDLDDTMYEEDDLDDTMYEEDESPDVTTTGGGFGKRDFEESTHRDDNYDLDNERDDLDEVSRQSRGNRMRRDDDDLDLEDNISKQGF